MIPIYQGVVISLLLFIAKMDDMVVCGNTYHRITFLLGSSGNSCLFCF